MNFTEEQAAVIEFARLDKRSLLISALAGAAKTTTLVAAAHKLPVVPTLCCAFNKRIAEEMAKRMPAHIETKTMNAIGHRVWGKTVGKKLILEADKGYSILSAIVDRLPPADRKEFGDAFASILRAVRKAKSSGYIPARFSSVGVSLLSREEFAEAVAPDSDVNPDDWFLSHVDEALGISIAQAFEGKIDFDDQIYMSTLFGGVYPVYDIVMVDEAQDLSPLNHLSLSKMVGKRLIAVGDSNQAIYGFRGAHTSSMSVLKDQFSMVELTLSISFRCPKAVIRRQWEKVPNMRWPEWAEEGKAEVLEELEIESIPDGATIICRNNAPLFSAAMRLIRRGRSIKIVGADIGKSLLKLLEGMGGKSDLKQESLLNAISTWEEKELAKAHKARRHAISDRAACLRVFAEAGDSKNAAVAFAKHIFAAAGPITLLTGHKSKGEEWDTVYHLSPSLVPSPWARKAAETGDSTQLEQELNLRYVIETRAKKELYLVELEDLI